jgi:hypothetical protein|tara:strand:+ start:64 stop:237 length:174 start_codon:yes stop_codon:yes gene_type:complete
MRLTEFINFLNSKKVPDKDEYSHLEIREEVEDDNGKVKYILKKKYREMKKNYRKELK